MNLFFTLQALAIAMLLMAHLAQSALNRRGHRWPVRWIGSAWAQGQSVSLETPRPERSPELAVSAVRNDTIGARAA